MKQIISLFLAFAMLTAPTAGLRNYEDSKDKGSPSIERSFLNDDPAKDRFSDFIEYTAPLSNTYHKLNNGEELNIVFVGGSVTAGFGSTDPDKYSWRALTSSWFVQNFHDVKINTFNAAIGGTGTSLGVYRLSDDVLSKKPDLVFIEYSINDIYATGDMYYERSLPEAESIYEHSAIQFETIVRNIKKEYPQCDIVTILVTDRERAEPDEPYPSADAHRDISKKYGIPVVDVGKALVSSLVSLDDNEWNVYFTDIVHPTDIGYKNYFDTLEEFLFNSLFAVDFSKAEKTSFSLPPVQSKVLLDGAPLLTHITEDILKDSKGFNFYSGAGGNISTLSNYAYTSDPNAEFVFSFSGTDIFVWTNLSNDSVISYSIDGGKERKAIGSMITHLASSLAPGDHTLVITPYNLGEESGGNMIIYALLTNDSSWRSIKGDK